jgi:hypothetical protein
MFRCYIPLDTKLFNDHILIKVLQRPLKCISNFFRGSADNPWVRYRLKNMEGKKGAGGGGKVLIKTMCGE